MGNLKTYLLLTGATAAVLSTGLCAAHADSTIVSQVTIAHSQDSNSDSAAPPPQPVTLSYTTYYKGDFARVELVGGSVTIYDAKKDKAYVLDADRKSYYELPLSKLLGGAAASSNDRVSLETNATVAAAQDTQTVAGVQTVKYLVDGSADLTPGSSGGGRGGGYGGGGFGRHRGGGGGYGGGGYGGTSGNPDSSSSTPGSNPGSHANLPSVTIAGEYWMSPSFDWITKDMRGKHLLLPIFSETLAGDTLAGALAKPIADKLSKSTGIPLAAKIVVTRTQQQWGSSIPTIASGPQTTISLAVTSISETAIADDSLFAVPTGYTKVNPPRQASSFRGKGQ